MTDDEAAAIAERAEAATPGPWEAGIWYEHVATPTPSGEWSYGYEPRDSEHGWRSIVSASAKTGYCEIVGPDFDDGELGGVTTNQADAAFIAHARADIPALLSERAALREALRKIAALEGYGATAAPALDLARAIARARLADKSKEQ